MDKVKSAVNSIEGVLKSSFLLGGVPTSRKANKSLKLRSVKKSTINVQKHHKAYAYLPVHTHALPVRSNRAVGHVNAQRLSPIHENTLHRSKRSLSSMSSRMSTRSSMRSSMRSSRRSTQGDLDFLGDMFSNLNNNEQKLAKNRADDEMLAALMKKVPTSTAAKRRTAQLKRIAKTAKVLGTTEKRASIRKRTPTKRLNINNHIAKQLYGSRVKKI